MLLQNSARSQMHALSVQNIGCAKFRVQKIESSQS